MLGSLDEVLEAGGGRGRARRGVPSTLPILATHFPRFPVLPGVLVLGDLATLAARVLEADRPGAWALRGGERVRYRSYVRPGDLVDLEVQVVGWEEQLAVCSGTASVAGKTVCTAARILMGAAS